MTKSKVVCSVVRHIDPITCLASDSSGSRHVMSGSRDTTSVVWEMSLPVGTSSVISLRPIQVNLFFVVQLAAEGHIIVTLVRVN